MSSAGPGSALGDGHPDGVLERAETLGRDLTAAFQHVLAAIPGSPHRPTTLARQLGLSRVIVSRLLNAIAQEDPCDVLEQVPGPESLRTLLRAAAGLGIPAEGTREAAEVIDRFARLIRDDFGTRSAFNAAITPRRPRAKARFDHSSRYQVYMGMRQVLGVEAETWLTSMFFAPVAGDPEALSVTTIHGALAMRRLRADVNVYFTFGPPRPAAAGGAVSAVPIDLREFCTNEPAPLETTQAGGQLVHRLTHDRLGRLSTVDMLAVSHNPRGTRRYAAPDRPRGGLVVFPDVPVKTLICDAIMHEDAFPGADPELIVYNPGARGPANPCDASRDIDRVSVDESILTPGRRADRFDLAEVPRYAGMVERVFEAMRMPADRFRVHRLRMSYPVHGFQFVMAFDAPPRPAPAL